MSNKKKWIYHPKNALYLSNLQLLYNNQNNLNTFVTIKQFKNIFVMIKLAFAVFL